jgi:putative ABC transport system permease protein
MKAMGFGGSYVAMLIFGESLAIALIGGVIGVLLTFPLAHAFTEKMGTLFPIFFITEQTVAMQLGAALLVGAVAAWWPAWHAARVRVVDGLRAIG